MLCLAKTKLRWSTFKGFEGHIEQTSAWEGKEQLCQCHKFACISACQMHLGFVSDSGKKWFGNLPTYVLLFFERCGLSKVQPKVYSETPTNPREKIAS